MRISAQKRLPSETHHELTWAPIVSLVLVAAILLPWLPAHRSPCLFLRLTGKPCVSCGMTRAFESAIRARFLDALQYNPLGLALFFVAVLYVPYAWAVVLFHLPALRIKLTARWEKISLIVVLVAVVVANWIYIWTNSLTY